MGTHCVVSTTASPPPPGCPSLTTARGRSRITHGEGLVDQPESGTSRVTIVHRETGAGALTTRIVTIEPGTRMRPHWHKVEEAIMGLEGEGQAVLGDEMMPINAVQTLLGPAGIRHGFINTGSVPIKLAVAFPAVEVETFFD